MSRFRTSCDAHSPSQGYTFTMPSRTKQSELADSDINNIMARYATTGQLPAMRDPSKAIYGDFAQIEDYQTSLAKVMEAEDKFNSLPSELRRKFDYSPQKMIDFIHDPNNREECIKYGFINKPVMEAPKASVADSSPDGNT